MHYNIKFLFLPLAILSLIGCEPQSSDAPTSPNAKGRWYTAEQAVAGKSVFQSHCATCHGPNAEGTADWTTRDANGNFPPPPLDGTAHAWHHPLEDLRKVIAQGGNAFGGVMPAFSETLDDTEISAAIAYFQQQWDDEIYERWLKIDEARQTSQEDESSP